MKKPWSYTYGSGGKKMRCGACAARCYSIYKRCIATARDLSCGDARAYVKFEIRRVNCKWCGKVKQEELEWLSSNPFYTKRFAYKVGERCRESSIKSVAEECHLNWKTVKELDKWYMREQLKRAPEPVPEVIGVDEISVKRKEKKETGTW